MSNFLTQFSSGSIAIDICYAVMVPAMVAMGVSMSKMFAARRKGDEGSVNVSMFFMIVTSIPFTLAFIISLAVSVETNASFSDVQGVPLMLISVTCIAVFFINLVRDLRRAEEDRDSDD